MLIRFTVGNYRSFWEPVELDMRATALKEHRATHVMRVQVSGKTYDLLRSAVLYGPNASGKSNFIQAMGLMRRLVLDSATKYQADEPLPIQPFKLHAQARQKPSLFEIVFLHEDKRYRYGFQADKERIREEWLYHARQRESLLFHRQEDEFYLSSRLSKAAALREHTRPNALFLSVMAQFNHPLGTSLLRWFRESFRGLQGGGIETYLGFTISRLKDEDFRRRIQGLVRLADFGIDDLEVKKEPLASLLSSLPEEFQNIIQKEIPEPDHASVERIQTLHGDTPFEFEEESDGTQKFIALLGPFLDVLDHGYVLAVDELEAHLHPFLTRTLVSLFHSPKVNAHNAQLIFTTHDLTLLDEELFRRDQIWFMEKTSQGATDLYSLADIGERKDVSLFKRYWEGRYGAVPHLAAFVPYLEQEMTHGAAT